MSQESHVIVIHICIDDKLLYSEMHLSFVLITTQDIKTCPHTKAQSALGRTNTKSFLCAFVSLCDTDMSSSFILTEKAV